MIKREIFPQEAFFTLATDVCKKSREEKLELSKFWF
jgi:hypothetical protein